MTISADANGDTSALIEPFCPMILGSSPGGRAGGSTQPWPPVDQTPAPSRRRSRQLGAHLSRKIDFYQIRDEAIRYSNPYFKDWHKRRAVLMMFQDYRIRCPA
jgi:hypothetical protein